MTSTFDILPAIDLRGGRVVRLERGDFDRETVFGSDPVEIANRFVAAGAHLLHVVDLDGARTGTPRHGEVIGRIVEAVGDRAAVEVSGGLRTEASVAETLSTGAARVVIGTAGLRDPGFTGSLVATHGRERIVAAIDVRAGRAVGEGWAEGADGRDPVEAIANLSATGVDTFEVTAIDRDGTGSGPDVGLYARLAQLDLGAIIASAGISSVADIAAVRAAGCTGAIIGRALYDGTLRLEEALRA
jgi:phosphoribosylformimino-5-aminoimidazole carboxamide ribotide isomerase